MHHPLILSMLVIAFVLLIHLMLNLHHVLFKQQSYLILVHYQVSCLISNFLFAKFVYFFPSCVFVLSLVSILQRLTLC